MKFSETPQFEHDCDKACRFLGHVNGRDLYYCVGHDETSDSFVCRYSSEDGAYSSCLVAEVGWHPGMAVAAALAHDAGLIDIFRLRLSKPYGFRKF